MTKQVITTRQSFGEIENYLGDEIPYSILISSTTHLIRRKFLTEGDRRKWTIDAWVRKVSVATTQVIFSASVPNNTGSLGYTRIMFGDNDKLYFYSYQNGVKCNIFSDQTFHDMNHYHIHIECDTAQVVMEDRLKGWVNDIPMTFTYTVAPEMNDTYQVGAAGDFVHTVGMDSYQSVYPFLGYISSFSYLDGITLGGPNNAFGRRNSLGQWVPKNYTGVHGTNGFRLDFAADNLGKDTSGNGNDMTISGLTMTNRYLDSPTHKYVIGDPLYKTSYVASWTYGSLNVSVPNGARGSSTIRISSGKWYWEYQLSAGVTGGGIDNVEDATYRRILFTRDGRIVSNSGTFAFGSRTSASDVISVELDMDNRTIAYYKNNILLGTLPLSTGLLDGYDVTPVISAGGGVTTTGSINFGQRPFIYTPREGFKSLNTYNYDDPIIANPEQHFIVRSNVGSGTFPLNWNPSVNKTLIVTKPRFETGHWMVRDTLRPGRVFNTNRPVVEYDDVDGLSFNNGGYTVGNNIEYSNERIDYAWRASPAAGFDILLVDHVSGTDTTVPHNAGGIVEYAWVCPLDTGTNRRVYHTSMGSNRYSVLNLTSIPITTTLPWFTTTDTTITIGSDLETGRYAIYLWRSIPQFSKFSSYIGNGLAGGIRFITDFTPAMVCIRRRDASGVLHLRDIVRTPTNPVQTYNVGFYTNVAENSHATYNMDMLSDGFSLLNNTTDINASNAVYMVAAWAKTPGKYAIGR